MPVSIYFRSPIPFVAEGLAQGLGGAETASIRMAKALNGEGIPTELIDTNTCTHQHSDVALVVRFPADVLRLKRKFKRVFFWPADDVQHPTFEPLLSPLMRDRFNQQIDGVLAISGYQQEQLINIGIEPTKILPTRYGIESTLFPARTGVPAPICIYTASPKRGLQLLPRIWPAISGSVPNASLLVCSSMKTYRGDDATLMPLFDSLAKLPNVTLCGSLPQTELAKMLCTSRVWLYPNTYPETASIATLEARAAGCVIVTRYSAALRETAAGNLFVPDSRSPYFESCLIAQTIRGLTDDALYNTISRRNQSLNSELDWRLVSRDLIDLLSLS